MTDHGRRASTEFLDHPADVRMHCTSTTLPELYETAVEGMMMYAVDVDGIGEEAGVFEVAGGSNEMKMIKVLTHFIDLMYGENLVVTGTKVAIHGDVLTCNYLATDGSRCSGLCEIKAVTLCGLEIFEKDGVFHLYCVLDV